MQENIYFFFLFYIFSIAKGTKKIPAKAEIFLFLFSYNKSAMIFSLSSAEK
jgi:hypothetical protein